MCETVILGKQAYTGPHGACRTKALNPIPILQKMSKSVINFWLDVLLLVVFLTLITVATILQFAFPPVAEMDGWSLWGWDYADWSQRCS